MPLPLLAFDDSGVARPELGVSAAELAALALARARGAILGSEPVDRACRWIDLPERLLAAYQQERAASELGRIMSAAARLRDKVDRVVVLGRGASLLGSQALRDACCQPYFNELSRGERGGYPRLYLAGDQLDNDALQGLLHLLGNSRPAASRDDHWGLVVIEESGAPLDSAGAFRHLFAALCGAYGGAADQARERLLLIAGAGSRFSQTTPSVDWCERFILPDGVGGTPSVLTAAGLVPAALMGLDILKLLEGAKALNDQFRTAPPMQNTVLRLAGVAHLLETKREAFFRLLCPWVQSLETAGQWCAQLLAERLGKRLAIVSPGNLRALASRPSRRDPLLVNLQVDEWRFDSLSLPPGELEQAATGQTPPAGWSAEVQAQRELQLRDHQPAVELRLPGTTPHAFGQFFQCWLLAAEVEGWLRANETHDLPDAPPQN